MITMSVPALNVAMMGYVALTTPPELQGRVESVGALLSMVLMPASSLVGALLLDAVGVRGAILLFAGLAGVGWLILATSSAIRTLPRLCDVASPVSREEDAGGR